MGKSLPPAQTVKRNRGCGSFREASGEDIDKESIKTFQDSLKDSNVEVTLVKRIEEYPPNEFIHEDDPSRQYQENSDILYYVIPHGHSLTELTQEKHVPKMIAPNEPDIPHTKDVEGPLDLINTEGNHEKNVQDEQIITQSTEGLSGNNTKVLVSIIESLVPGVPQS
ncbi:hypothetical protein Tco_0857888 [Tanacetum coccineum]|uniref:Uncharacterized protein n=1 Tax=Tanacetum coccineum TaxID=301880 RepID=A0ABQ5BBE1_9ASTR